MCKEKSKYFSENQCNNLSINYLFIMKLICIRMFGNITSYILYYSRLKASVLLACVLQRHSTVHMEYGIWTTIYLLFISSYPMSLDKFWWIRKWKFKMKLIMQCKRRTDFNGTTKMNRFAYVIHVECWAKNLMMNAHLISGWLLAAFRKRILCKTQHKPWKYIQCTSHNSHSMRLD